MEAPMPVHPDSRQGRRGDLVVPVVYNTKMAPRQDQRGQYQPLRVGVQAGEWQLSEAEGVQRAPFFGRRDGGVLERD